MQNTDKTLELFLLEEKYHPKSMDEVILPFRMKKFFNGVIETGNITNYLFSGSPGCGKTTVAKVLCESIGIEHYIVEASVNNGIDYIRNNIMEMAQSSTLNGKYKCLILDEADHISQQAQAALRNVINVTQNHCRFILTANYPEKIIPPLRDSRIPVIKFEFTKDELLKEMAPMLWKRLMKIIKSEGYEIEEVASLQKFMVENLPNIRFILKTIQMVAATENGKISSDIHVNTAIISMEMFKAILDSPYEDIMRFVMRTSQEEIVKFIMDNLEQLTDDKQKQLQIVTWTAHYQSMFKGVEEIYTIALLLNIANILK